MLPAVGEADRLAYTAWLGLKPASRGRIRERCRQGFSERPGSQRRIVAADASVTPYSLTSRCSSVREKRPRLPDRA